jgi:hypothetical protein
MNITAGMVGRQARLMSRSAGLIARNPRYASGLRRLAMTGGRSTVSLRLPWLPFDLIDDLRERVGPRSRVFEFGGGGSTLFFLDCGAEVLTVEHDPSWMGRLEELAGTRTWSGLLQPLDDPDAYVASITEHPDDYFDVVVVDGRERARCALAALSKVRPGGWLVFDDVDRERYVEGLQKVQWPRRDYIGFAPAKPSLAFTSVFEKPPTE